MGNAGFELLRKKFSQAAVVQGYLDLYERLMAER